MVYLYIGNFIVLQAKVVFLQVYIIGNNSQPNSK